MLAGVVAARNTAIPGEFARRRLARVRTPPLLLTEVRRAGHTAGRSSFKLYDRTQRLGKLTDIVVRRIAQTVPCHCAFGTRRYGVTLSRVCLCLFVDWYPMCLASACSGHQDSYLFFPAAIASSPPIIGRLES